MSTIGIDYQRTVTILCLAEGQGAATRPRSVGDGLRSIIPNAVAADDLWGSKAINAGGSAPEPEDGPWLAGPDAAQFWGHLFRRVYSFLGRIPPTAQRGYRFVAGLQAADFSSASAGVERLCANAGFAAPTCINSTDALLSRHIAELQLRAAGDATIVTVVAGDTSTAVSSYRLNFDGALPRLIARDTTPRRLPYGQAHWTGRLLINLSDLFTEPIRSGFELALRDSALEFGSRLRRAPEGRAIGWTGPLRDKLYSPLDLTLADCCAWPEAVPVIDRLPDLIRDSIASLGRPGRPDIILVGGIGAIWPFAGVAASTVGRVVQSDHPEEDVARGAAWWPEVEAVWSDSQLPMPTSLPDVPMPDWLSGGPSDLLADIDVSSFESTTAVIGETTSTIASIQVDPVFTESSKSFLREEAGETPSGLAMPEIKPIGSLSTLEASDPIDQIAIKETDVSLISNIAPEGSLYDLDAMSATKEVSTADEGLEDLPPWDPRRNDL